LLRERPRKDSDMRLSTLSVLALVCLVATAIGTPAAKACSFGSFGVSSYSYAPPVAVFAIAPPPVALLQQPVPVAVATPAPAPTVLSSYAAPVPVAITAPASVIVTAPVLGLATNYGHFGSHFGSGFRHGDNFGIGRGVPSRPPVNININTTRRQARLAQRGR
jgi:hypothetical protein